MTFPFAARTNAPNTRAASMEPLEVLLSTHNPQVDKLLGVGFPCKGFVELLTTGERRNLSADSCAHSCEARGMDPPAAGLHAICPRFRGGWH